jgi:hypothetical protein
VESYSGDEVRLFGRITGLVNLAEVRRSCAPLPRDRWRSVIGTHLTHLARAAECAVPLGDLNVVRPLLRSRITSPDSVPSACVSRPVAAGLSEVLVVLSGEGVATVPRDLVRRWRVPPAQLFEQARGQVLDDGLFTRRSVDLGGFQATVLEDPSTFTATHVLWLATYLDVGPAGAVVAIPTQALVMAHALRDGSALDAVQALLMNASRLYNDGPHSVSPGVYWWRPDRPLVALPAEVTAARISFYPPAEFVDTLAQLPPPG